jgi:hypothetical protein
MLLGLMDGKGGRKAAVCPLADSCGRPPQEGGDKAALEKKGGDVK